MSYSVEAGWGVTLSHIGLGASEDGSGNTQYYSGPIVLPQNGTYQSNFDFLGFAQPVVVNLYDATPESGTISIGGPAVTVSTGPAQYDALSFTGTAGQPVSFFVTNSTYNVGEPMISMTNPDGSFLSTDFCDSYDTGNTSICFFTLPQAGTYVAQISGYYDRGGTADVQLFDATPLNESISINGPPVSVNSNPGQPVELSFTYTYGQYDNLSLSISDGSSYGSEALSYPYPYTGSVNSPISGSQVSVGMPLLPVTGTYTIELVDYTGSGSATLQLSASSPEYLTTSVGGPPVDVTLQMPGELAIITFSVNAPQSVGVVTSNSTFTNGCAAIELLNPDGSEADWLWACDLTDRMSPPQLAPGAYSIFVDGSGATGSIDITVTDATPVIGAISIDGAPVVPSMSAPSQNVEYTFSGTAGQQVGLSVTSFSSYNLDACSPEITLSDPEGNYIDSIDLYPGEFPDGTATLNSGADVLASDGTYTIFLDNTGCSTGSAQIDLYTSNTETGTISLNGAAVTAASSVPGQPTQVTINGGAGQSIQLNTSNSTYQDCVIIELIDQSQAELGNYIVVDSLYQCGTSATMGPDTLSSDTYTLLVTPSGEAGSIDLSLSSQ